MSEEVFFSAAQAVGKGLDYLTSEDRAKALSKIPDNKTRGKLQLAFAMGEMFPFMHDHATTALLLLVSDGKATGRTGLQEVLKAQVAADRLSMKDRLMGFIGRGEGS